MKKTIALILSLMLLAIPLALADGAEGGSALDAFYALTGKNQQIDVPRAAADYLADAVNGKYAALPATQTELAAMAADLNALTAVSSRDIAAYASAAQMSVKQVRNAYYKALANVLRAEIAVHPASEEKYANVQMILSLFLDQSDPADDAARSAIRGEMTADAAAAIARDAALPGDFVTFLIMNDDWNDTRWDNDDVWRAGVTWDDAYDNADALERGDRDSRTSTSVADMQSRLIALGYLTGKADGIFGARTEAALIQYQRANGLPADGVFSSDDAAMLLGSDVVARWDYQNSFDDTPAYLDTPNNTPDHTPDNTPNYANTPAYRDTPDNTPDRTPDNTPDNTRDNTPDNTP